MNKYNTNPVIKRIAVKALMTFETPALIGSGESEETDRDVLREGGKLLLPGSSLAGVLRSRLEESGDGLDDGKAAGSQLFGSLSDGGEMSALWVYDTPLSGEVILLDGVALDYETKTAIAAKKYDCEAVSAGASGTIRLMLVIRQNDNPVSKGSPVSLEESLNSLLYELQQGTIRVGGKTTRGFGKIACPNILTQEFPLQPGNLDELERWEQFQWSDPEAKWTKWKPSEGNVGLAGTSVLTAKLQLEGGLMIRSTHNLTGTEDYRHTSMGDKAVIYGTSWAGAFRGGLYNLLRPRFNSTQDTTAYLDEHFGYVREEGRDSQTLPSKIRFDVSVFGEADKDSGYRTLTRVKIDRFTGGAAPGALFTEQPWFGGGTTLTIHFPKGAEETKKLLLLALDALDKKLLTVGGETSVGRGMFTVLSVDVDGMEVMEFRKEGATHV